MTKAALSFLEAHDIPAPNAGHSLLFVLDSMAPFWAALITHNATIIHSLKPQCDGQVVKVLEGQLCPECQSTLILRQGCFGMFIDCSNYLECGHIAPTAVADATAFTCHQCCTGKLVQQTSRFGKSFYAYDRYPACNYALNNQSVAGANARIAISRCEWRTIPPAAQSGFVPIKAAAGW